MSSKDFNKDEKNERLWQVEKWCEVKNTPRGMETINKSTKDCKCIFEEQRIVHVDDLWKNIKGKDCGPPGA